jgi:hypothetical protein
MADTSNEVATQKKARNVDNFYVAADGSRASRPQPDVVAFGKKFLGNGHEIIKKLSDFPDAVLSQAAAFGLQQVVQNAYGAATDDDERVELAEARLETLEGGSWAADRQTGPRSSDLVDAWCQAREESGKAVNDVWRDAARQKLESGEVTAKDLQANPRIKAKLDAIKAQRAIERAKKSRTLWQMPVIRQMLFSTSIATQEPREQSLGFFVFRAQVAKLESDGEMPSQRTKDSPILVPLSKNFEHLRRDFHSFCAAKSKFRSFRAKGRNRTG